MRLECRLDQSTTGCLVLDTAKQVELIDNEATSLHAPIMFLHAAGSTQLQRRLKYMNGGQAKACTTFWKNEVTATTH